MRGRKHKPVEHEDPHRWVISYADFITLLFAFFVVMYAISSVNVSKYKSLAEGMNSAFNKKDKNQAARDRNSKKNGQSADAGKDKQEDFNLMDKSLGELQDSDYSVNSHADWVELDIKAEALFDSGSADLKPLALVKLKKLAGILRKSSYPIALEGYTDNLPINTPQYPSNWELSSARAAALARSLTTFGVDPSRLSVTGFGEQYPIDSNITEEGRSKNRRVNLIISKDKSVPRLLNPEISIQKKKALVSDFLVGPGASVIPPISKDGLK